MSGITNDFYTMEVSITGGGWRKHEVDGEECRGYLQVSMQYKDIRKAIEEPIEGACSQCGKVFELTQEEVADSLSQIAREIRDRGRDLQEYARGLYIEHSKKTLAEQLEKALNRDDPDFVKHGVEWAISHAVDATARNIGDSYRRQYGNLG